MITLSKKIAADTVKEIKEKNPEVVDSTTIEDAHGKDVYVAEADGSRGRASNVEEVRQEVLNIINKIPKNNKDKLKILKEDCLNSLIV